MKLLRFFEQGQLALPARFETRSRLSERISTGGVGLYHRNFSGSYR